MAIRHIREAYNQESGDHSICQGARLVYVPGDKPGDPQKQVIELDIVRSDGTPETIATDAHAMDANPHEQVRMLSKSLKARDGVKYTLPAPYVPPPIDKPLSLWEKLKGQGPSVGVKRPPADPAAAASGLEQKPLSSEPSTTTRVPRNPWIE